MWRGEVFPASIAESDVVRTTIEYESVANPKVAHPGSKRGRRHMLCGKSAGSERWPRCIRRILGAGGCVRAGSGRLRAWMGALRMLTAAWVRCAVDGCARARACARQDTTGPPISFLELEPHEQNQKFRSRLKEYCQKVRNPSSPYGSISHVAPGNLHPAPCDVRPACVVDARCIRRPTLRVWKRRPR